MKRLLRPQVATCYRTGMYRISVFSVEPAMRIDTQRFGTLELNPDQLFLFPQGLIGMESLRQWALLPDVDNPTVAWLQSASRGTEQSR